MPNAMAPQGAGLSVGINKPQRMVQITEVKNGFLMSGYGFGETEVYLTLDEVKARLDSFFAPETTA